MRIGVPAARARSATSATFSGPPMLPGLRRMQCAPASIAFSASVWLKWMSAMIGIGDSTTIVFSASMSLSRGTATRTMSAPASATRADLVHRRGEVGRLGLRHRLDDDRGAPADLNPAHVHVSLGSHAASSLEARARNGPSRPTPAVDEQPQPVAARRQAAERHPRRSGARRARERSR